MWCTRWHGLQLQQPRSNVAAHADDDPPTCKPHQPALYILQVLNRAIFPINYPERMYKDVLAVPEVTQVGAGLRLRLRLAGVPRAAAGQDGECMWAPLRPDTRHLLHPSTAGLPQRRAGGRHRLPPGAHAAGGCWRALLMVAICFAPS